LARLTEAWPTFINSAALGMETGITSFEVFALPGPPSPCLMFAICAAIIARWLSSRCLRWMFFEITKAASALGSSLRH
jgi:hypothetical protein